MRLGARAIACVRDHGRIQYWLPVERPRAGPGDKGRDKHAGPEKGDSIHQRTSREVESPSPVASPEDHGIIIANPPLVRTTLVEPPTHPSCRPGHLSTRTVSIRSTRHPVTPDRMG